MSNKYSNIFFDAAQKLCVKKELIITKLVEQVW